MVEAIEIYEVRKSSGRWDTPLEDHSIKTFRREYQARRKAEDLQQNVPDSESWDNVMYYVKPKLIKPSELKYYKFDVEKRPENFVHKEDVEPIPDTCGSIRELVASENLSLAYVNLSGKAKKHKHSIMEEMYYVTKGEGYLTIEKNKYKIEEGDTVSIPKNEWHFLETEEGQSLEILVVTHPKFTIEDVITE